MIDKRFVRLPVLELTLLWMGLAVLGGCGGNGPAAEIVDNVISTQILGKADDADSTTPPDQYVGPADLDAADQRTKSSSVRPKFNEVAGKAEAESPDPGPGVAAGMSAVATSFNKVVTQFRVNNAGAFTFDIALDVDQVELTRGGTVTVQVLAALLDNQGAAVPNGGVANITFVFQRNGAGGIDVVIAGDTSNPDTTQANGDYNRTLSGPNGGVQLRAGNYRLELDLRITATAPVQIGDDGQRHRAALEMAKATITLR